MNATVFFSSSLILFSIAAPAPAQSTCCESSSRTALQEAQATRLDPLTGRFLAAGQATLRGFELTQSRAGTTPSSGVFLQDPETAVEPLRELGYFGVSEPQDERGYIGISINVEDGAMIVTSVRDGSPAQELGLERGDRITRVGEHVIKGEEALFEHLESLRAGQTINIRVDRSGWIKEMDVTLAGPEVLERSSRLERVEELETPGIPFELGVIGIDLEALDVPFDPRDIGVDVQGLNQGRFQIDPFESFRTVKVYSRQGSDSPETQVRVWINGEEVDPESLEGQQALEDTPAIEDTPKEAVRWPRREFFSRESDVRQPPQLRRGDEASTLARMQDEIAELRAELDRLRSLREELRELDGLRRELREAMRKLDKD